ncbi:response regulator [Anaerocolumna sp. AGMB13025]|uniref:response regulator transcription factor n=1 Tax=Anaerocolumna sp. AGMB13025 TaxID=3039116 RepID=UPI00241BED93|nr:response regulator [Anaerocolumna sp. AGMB13025]WFR57922.1 response regulator [Anaerocolumna sp. AGMB13025]
MISKIINVRVGIISMVKLAIVEDEKILLDDLENNIDWEAMEVTVAFTERNGIHALRRIKREPVDIVITDIRMPVMNGIEMAQELHKLDSNIQIIFLTGFDDVEYMKSAIQLNIVSYISKPFREEELQAAVQTALNRISLLQNAVIGKQNRLEKALSELIFSGNQSGNLFQGDFTMMLACISRFNAIYNARSAAEVNWLVEDIKERIQYFLSCRVEKYVVLYLSKGHYLILTDAGYDFKNLQSADYTELNDTLENSIHIDLHYQDICSKVTADQFQKAYQDIMKVYENSFYTLSRRNLVRDAAVVVKKQLMSGIISMEQNKCQQILERYFNALAVEKPSKDTIKAECYEICNKIYELFFAASKEIEAVVREKRDILKALEEYDNIEQIEKYISTLLRNAFHYKQNLESGTDNDVQMVNRVILYINKNYDKPISAENLVEQFYFASNTIRSIFKRQTGKTIHEYLTETRMERARVLLENGSLKIKEISERVGYDSVSYFCMRFSRNFGVSPLSYRKKIVCLKEQENSEYETNQI